MAARRLTRRAASVVVLALPAVMLAAVLPSGAAPTGAVAAVAPPVGAGAPLADRVTQRKKAVDRAIAEVREQLEGTAQDLVEAVVSLKRIEADLDEARADLRRAQDEERKADKQHDKFVARRDQAAAAQDAAELEVVEGETAVAATRRELGLFARQAYVTDGATSQLSLALDATSPEDFAAAMSATATALRLKKAAQDRLDTQLIENLQHSRVQQAAASQAQAYEAAAAAVLAEKEDAADRAAAAEARIAKLVAAQQAVVRVITARKGAEQARLDALAAEQNKLRQMLAARAAAALARARHRGPVYVTSGSGFLTLPAPGRISDEFGWRAHHPITGRRTFHTGTDFAVPCGTTVHAAADGVVVLANWAGGYGNRVVIDHGVVHGVSLATTYNHNSRLLVNPGQYVHRGQPVSISGTTGSSTGCHLHFEVLANGGYVNPMGWL